MNYIGIDVGSTTCKIVIIDDNCDIVYKKSEYICGDVLETVMDLVNENPEVLDDVERVGVTGSSRRLVANHFATTIVNSEVIAHSIAAIHRHKVGTLIEIGGQDAKFVAFDKGIVNDFQLNSSCAAGTGAFLESQCRRLGIELSQLDDFVECSDEEIILSGKCGVFIESAVLSCQKMGIRRENIAKAVCRTLVDNYVNEFCKDRELAEPIWFQGGVAKFRSIRQLFSETLQKEVRVDEDCEFMGALGSALLAKNSDVQESFDKEKLVNVSTYERKSIFCRKCKQNCTLLGYYQHEELKFKVGGRCGRYS